MSSIRPAQRMPCPFVRNGTDRDAPEGLGAGCARAAEPLTRAACIANKAQEGGQCPPDISIANISTCKVGGS
jgi:hypothetical protein